MDTTRWLRIEGLFHELADLPPGAARDAALAARCGDDQALAAEVRALLDQDAHLEAGASAADPHLGLRLGHYEITTLIARGGMAAVYEARRADDQFQQRVAVKIMDLRLSDPGLAAQFRAERQILAALEHPSLTRLLDGGVTTLGEPYLVMEYVEGQAIDRYCDTGRLDVPARLRLFMEVCDGVAFAHRNLVLHRDLKPSNILVTREGRAKVVDFGTATLLQPDRLATTSMAPLTPAYASPEQLTGKAVGTASDQYSLGLVLFELLTGGAAFGERTSLMAAVERALAATTTTAPHLAVTEAAASTRQTSLAKLRRTLSGDLATILAKALAHEPSARYASVQHFADDVRRWLSGAPILARPPSLAYQSSRFVHRHWVATSVAATLTVALVVATGVSLQQAALARRQADEAQRQAAAARTESEKNRQMNRFLTRMLSSANPTWNNANAAVASSITVRQVLDGAGALIGTELVDLPDVEAEMRRTLGRTYIGLGAPDQALPHLERALALSTARGDGGGEAASEMALATIRLHRGDYAAAEALLRKVRRYLLAHERDVDPEMAFIATSDLSTVIGYLRPGDAEALELIREAIAVADRANITAGVAVAVNNAATQLYRAGRLDESEAAYRDAERRMTALPAPPPELHMLRANLANVMRVRGRAEDAERLAAEAAAGARRSWPAEHPYHAQIQQTWGRALVAAGQPMRGRDALLEALRLIRRLRSAEHPDIATPLIGLGVAYRELGDLAASERVLREARVLLRAPTAGRDRAADAAGELGMTLRATGRLGDASPLLQESLELYQAQYGQAHPLTQLALARLRGTAD
ncbi:MAG: protein kinase [Acidobacteria bacterium]|nr:protein kinase [Acidobacteriota bacterium]